MDKKFLHTVKAPNYSTEYYYSNKDCMYFKRNHKRINATIETDVFAGFWSFAFAKTPFNMIKARRLGKTLALNGPIAAFFPFYSIVEWEIAAGVFNWEGFISSIPLPPNFPKKPVAFRWDGNRPETVNDIFSVISEFPIFTPIDKIEFKSTLALKTKNYIDQNFNRELPIAQIANNFECKHSALTRAFKNCYGITPVDYRSKLRVMDATRLMLFENKNSTKAGFESGFTDISRFNKQFLRNTNTSPSKFRLNNEVGKNVID